jgi:outer membrane protein assembly factor BamB
MKRCTLKIGIAAICAAAGCLVADAGEWPQYRGPHGDGISTETISSWPAGGPKRAWKTETPAGFSSFVVDSGRVYTIVTRTVGGAPIAMCVALDANTGKEIWAAPTGPANFPGGADAGAEGNNGGDGPRSTPAVSDGRVFIYSADMTLHCLDAASGKSVWKKDIAKEFNGKNISWKSALSPVADGEAIYIAGGGADASMLALKAATGDVIWKTGDERMTHATPVVATILGVKQVIFMMQSGMVSVGAQSGKVLWKFPFPYRTATGCSPVVSGDIVFCSAGYGIGAAACQLSKSGENFGAKEIWRVRGDNPLGDLWSTPVQKDGFLYGMISYKKFASGPLKCVDLKTGTVKWEQAGFGSGNVILAGAKLVALSDDGQVVLAAADPSAYKELGRTKAIAGKCWSTPALSDGRLFVRSTKEGARLDFPVGKN